MKPKRPFNIKDYQPGPYERGHDVGHHGGLSAALSVINELIEQLSSDAELRNGAVMAYNAVAEHFRKTFPQEES